jgi:hypothetical protein
VRLRDKPTFGNALLAGALSGLACLTRITAFIFIVPGLVWLVLDGPRPLWIERAKRAGLAILVAAAIVGPYLINCAIATGDPLLSINYHTSFYRFAEGQPIDQPMSAAQYLKSKFAARPVATFDTGLNGLFVQPFITKWRGLEAWVPGAGLVLQWLALAGLVSWPFFASGRLTLVVPLSSLAPYIFTWNLAGGGEWRFTMHAYPFYLVAASTAIVGGARLLGSLVQNRGAVPRATLVLAGWRVAAVVLAAALGVAAYLLLPWYVIREAIANNESTSVETGVRDRVFYRTGWSRPHAEGLVTVRVSRTERPVVRIPLSAKRDYDIVLRIDPAVPGTQNRVSVLFNRHLVGAIPLGWNPERVGTYRVRVTERMVTAGSNELIIIPNTLVTAGTAGPRFTWLDPADKIGVRLWYVRILPL